MGKSYFEKLRDPRWQKKRLEILERDGFRCINCGDGEHELHVHHLVYPGKKQSPWDVPSRYLETLCALCHWVRTEHDASEIFDVRIKPTPEVLYPEGIMDCLGINGYQGKEDFYDAK